MKKELFLLVGFMVFLAGCAVDDTVPDIVEGRVTCEEPRPEVCAAVYDPVCGNDGRTYSNSCVACANPAVDYSTQGECGNS